MESMAESSPMNPTSHPSLLNLPPDLQNLRQQIFHLDSPVTMPIDQFNRAWKYLDNMYVYNQKREGKRKRRVVSYWKCRLWRSTPHPDVIPAEKRQRARSTREAFGCPCKIKMVKDESMVTITRTTEGHNHDYSAVEYKITSGVRELAAEEFSKGYRPSQITHNFKKNLDVLEIAGGGSLTSKDVLNAGQRWLQDHPDAQIEEQEYIDEPVDNEAGPSTQQKLWVQESLDGILSHYYYLEAETSEWPSELRDEAFQSWTRSLDRIRHESVSQFRKRLSPASLRVLDGVEEERQTDAPE